MTHPLRRFWLRLARLGAPAPHDKSVDDVSWDRPAFPDENRAKDTPDVETGRPGFKPPFASQWLLHDILFILILLLALTGVILRLSFMYWVVLTPIFALVSIAEGWRHFHTSSERVGLAWRIAAIWCALLMCIYLLYDSGVQGVMSLNASSLTMTILLALGMFVAGVQARVWQISAIGAVLFLGAPALGWLNQSSLLVTATVFAIVVLGGIVWWIRHRASRVEAEAPSPSVAPLDDASHSR
ncbi:hypothetical protein M2321_003756 [Rhodoblastus acidophilus]|uniref:hypothetical protein n=1 Tax=Rhodoblastus acidophilus TaxID=1074 RepID=UPI0018B0D506|nr:hypothetical protein [Rhodoblastus acidophilus]MCW2276152.1 hypothetical protein [Rhodoblastus acidophilus]